MPEVDVQVTAVSEGDDVYDAHAAGLRRVAAATNEASAATDRASRSFGQTRQGLTGFIAAVGVARSSMSLFGIQNEAVAKALDAVVLGLAIVRTALIIHKAVVGSTALAEWGLAAAKLASSAWFAPVILGVIAAAVGGLWALSSRGAFGLDMVVPGRTLIMAGEGGPEPVKVGAAATSAGVQVGSVNVNVYATDPEAAGRAVADYILRLKQGGM